VQYIHDAVLPAPNAFEENMLSTLSSFIFFNKVEIVTLIQVTQYQKFSVSINLSPSGGNVFHLLPADDF
jgi:hypothetical protein